MVDMSSTTSSIDQIYKALNDVNDQLRRYAKTLEADYARVHALSPSHTNAYNLVLRIRALEMELPDLTNALMTHHNRKAKLTNLIEHHLRESYSFAQIAEPQLISRNDASSSSNLSERLAYINNDLGLVLDHFPAGDNGTPRGQQQAPSTALLHVQTPSTASATPVGTPKSKGAPSPATMPPSSGTKQAKTPRSNVTPKTSANFEPISKAMFNRLPRNLKIRAGKLSEVNKFYETVFNALNSANGGCLSDKQLMQATGEGSTQRFEVLRGLAVLRCGEQGWTLASKKA